MNFVVPILAWVVVAAFAVGLWRKWNVPLTDPSFAKPPWWVWGDVWWKGYRRGVLSAALVTLSFALALTLPSSIGPPIALAGVLIFFPLGVSSALFNRPKFLVPPACRTQMGALAEKRALKATSRP